METRLSGRRSARRSPEQQSLAERGVRRLLPESARFAMYKIA